MFVFPYGFQVFWKQLLDEKVIGNFVLIFAKNGIIKIAIRNSIDKYPKTHFRSTDPFQQIGLIVSVII